MILSVHSLMQIKLLSVVYLLSFIDYLVFSLLIYTYILLQ